MPNGESKNWIRFLITLESFYALHGRWPTVIHLYPFFITELQERLTEDDFQVILSKIKLVPDVDNPFLALDELGNKFDYCHGKTPSGEPEVEARKWLKVNDPGYSD